VAEEGDTLEVAWDDRDEQGVPEVHRVRLDVLSVQRYVPDTVRIHAPVTTPGSLADDEAATEEVGA